MRNNENTELLELYCGQQECFYDEPNTTSATETHCNMPYVVDLHERTASQSVADHRSISEYQYTENLRPVLKPEISSSEHYYSSVEVKELKKISTYSIQSENKISVNHDPSIQDKTSWSNELEKQYEALRSSTSSMEEDVAITDKRQKPDPIYSKPDKQDKRYKTKHKAFVETCKTPNEIDGKQFEDVPATHIAPEKPSPYAATHKKSFKKPKENEEEHDLNMINGTYNELVTLVKLPLTEFNLYDEAEKVLTEKESTVLADHPKANEDLTNLGTLTNTFRLRTLLSDSLSRNGDSGVQSDANMYDEPGQII